MGFDDKKFAYGTGRRKEAVARVRLYPGSGKFEINGKSLEEYFPIATLQYIVMQPLVLTDATQRYNIVANIRGGGISGQAGALRHGIARAMVEDDAERYRGQLKKAGFLTRDAREKERKKPGLKKARKSSQFSKR